MPELKGDKEIDFCIKLESMLKKEFPGFESQLALFGMLVNKMFLDRTRDIGVTDTRAELDTWIKTVNKGFDACNIFFPNELSN